MSRNLNCALRFAALFVCAAATASIAQAPNSGVGNVSRHLVFAHYMVCFMNSKEFYKREIELAQRHGIDGFALNCGDWAQIDGKTGELTSGNYRLAADRMYAAAQELGTGFKLFLSADVNGLNPIAIQMSDMVKRYYKRPNQFRYNGKSVISAWGGSPEYFAPVIRDLKKSGYDVMFVPFLYNPRYTSNWSPETVETFIKGKDEIDGLFNFGADNTTAEILRNNRVGRSVTTQLGKIYMAGDSPAYNSANLRDFHGMEGYSEIWKGIIKDDSDWVELVTWNDYVEDSNLMPFRWSVDQNKPYFDRDESFLDLTSYYSSWYKRGAAPAITQEKLYYVYRNRSRNLRQAWDEGSKQWADISFTPFPYDQMHDDVLDNVYVTMALIAPANLTVTIGKSKHTYPVPAGMNTMAVPMTPGVPHFLLERTQAGKRQVIFDTLGRKQIIAEATEANSVRGMHLGNRTWTGGDVAGKAITLLAATGKMGPATSLTQVDGASAILITEQADSGFTLPLSTLKTGTYCIRIRYSNPGATETRLTVTADGPFVEPGDHPYMIPAFLPPTGAGKIAVTSFLWSLYDKTTFLSITWQPGPKDLPQENDHGTASIMGVEIVKVDDIAPSPEKPVVASIVTRLGVGNDTIAENSNTTSVTTSAAVGSKFGEMVSVPGGTFTMGGTNGNPDEKPAHPVTLSPFAMGKYDVTNAEFERFDPGHRAFRDSFSKSDRDPVIYVSWNDGAKYCNWLSKQAGLTPAYDEKTWALDAKADGFRLPTEAEWEYCATGRGENRAYPWGSGAPDATRGNIAGIRALSQSADVILADTGGTVPVGSYPLGASRDGIMDMAGNVSTWCSDTYLPYPAEAQRDPMSQAASNYRVIRGGSFGYYNLTQRSQHREFNNPNYPGYIYIGLRVALPATGAHKLGY